MPYGLIIIFGAIALTLKHVFTTTVSTASKVVVVGVLGFCLGCFFWWHRFTLAASFIMVGLAVYISIYRVVAQARASGRKELE